MNFIRPVLMCSLRVVISWFPMMRLEHLKKNTLNGPKNNQCVLLVLLKLIVLDRRMAFGGRHFAVSLCDAQL